MELVWNSVILLWLWGHFDILRDRTYLTAKYEVLQSIFGHFQKLDKLGTVVPVNYKSGPIFSIQTATVCTEIMWFEESI